MPSKESDGRKTHIKIGLRKIDVPQLIESFGDQPFNAKTVQNAINERYRFTGRVTAMDGLNVVTIACEHFEMEFGKGGWRVLGRFYNPPVEFVNPHNEWETDPQRLVGPTAKVDQSKAEEFQRLNPRWVKR